MIVDVKLTTDQEFKTEFMETRSAIDSNLIKPTGENGLSAYEIAVINGFSGSESEWLKSLVGPKGDKGENGYTPVKGTDYWTSEDEASIISDLIATDEFKAKLDFKEGKENNAGDDIDHYFDSTPTLYKVTSTGFTLIGSTEFNPYYLIVMKGIYSAGLSDPVKTYVQYKIASSGIYRRYYISDTLSYWSEWEELSPGTDITPTEGSKKFITSGGVYEALQNIEANKADKSELSKYIELENITVSAIKGSEASVEKVVTDNIMNLNFVLPKGDTGEQGISGVYVGTGDMPEGYNVQIDPSGTTESYLNEQEVKTYIDETILGGAW